MLNVFYKVGFILLLILLIINIFAFEMFGTASQPISFTSLLEQFESAPVIDLSISEISDNMKITADWGSILNPLRDFINFFAYIMAFFVWIGTLLYNVVVMVGYLLYLLGVQGFSALT